MVDERTIDDIEDEISELEGEEPEGPRFSRESQRIEDELRAFTEAEERAQQEAGHAKEAEAYRAGVRETLEQAQPEAPPEAVTSAPQRDIDEEIKLARLELAQERLKQARERKKGSAPPVKASTIRKIATLGGPIKANKRTRELYLATGLKTTVKPSMKAYNLSGMKGLTAPGSLTKLRTATMPQPMKGSPNLGLRRPGVDLSQLREAGKLSRSPFAVNLNLNNLRRMAIPRGWTRTEALAYEEIKQNHDVDTKSHVVSELMALGVSKAEASKAISSLLRKRVIRHKGKFGGEPILEVVGR